MGNHLDSEQSKSRRVSLLRRYGMGVPDATRALRSAVDALTLVSEAQIHPYERERASGPGKVREMNLHQLPWPIEQLEALGCCRIANPFRYRGLADAPRRYERGC
jgi:hypothetical protein